MPKGDVLFQMSYIPNDQCIQQRFCQSKNNKTAMYFYWQCFDGKEQPNQSPGQYLSLQYARHISCKLYFDFRILQTNGCHDGYLYFH